jgi:hypothetical protein
MSYQKRFLILNLSLFLLGMGATVGCRAEGAAAPRTVSDSQNASRLLCTVDFPPCVSAILASQTTAHYTGRQSDIKVRPSQPASGWRGANAGWQTSHRPVSGKKVNFSEASTGADTGANKGRLALNVTLDSDYQGTSYNIQAPFEPMQVSLNYIRAW